MERKFTLRISDEEDKQLQKLKDKLGIKTDTGAIAHLIMNFQNVTEDLNKTRSELQKTSRERDLLKIKINNFLNAFGELKK